MITPLTRRLLREWKRHSFIQDDLFYVKPQDNNLHIWHFVLYDDTLNLEVYLMCLIKDSDHLNEQPIILMRCLTPNQMFPLDMNICLDYMSPIIMVNGLFGFVDHLRRYLFDKKEFEDGDLMKGWNRTVCKDFKWMFPMLVDRFPLLPSSLKKVEDYLEHRIRKVPNTLARTNNTMKKFQFDHIPILACDNSSNINDSVSKPVKKQKSTEGEYITKTLKINECYKRKPLQ